MSCIQQYIYINIYRGVHVLVFLEGLLAGVKDMYSCATRFEFPMAPRAPRSQPSGTSPYTSRLAIFGLAGS